jgi:GPH family glycoside/pentoside/hexuronide:cation symporter
MAIEEDLSQWEIASTGKMISYGFGYVFVNYLLLYGLANLLYFYEVEIGLSAIYILLAGVVFALWNMVNDPLLGFLTDKPLKWTKRYGLRAPWVVVCTPLVLIFFYLIWVPPQGMGALVMFLWFILMTCAFDTFFSIYNDHMYGGYTNQFPSEYERRRSFAIATIIMFVVITAMVVISAFIIQFGNPASFASWSIVMIILLGFYSIIIFPGIRESEEMKQMFITAYDKAEKATFFQTLKVSLKTKNFRVSLAGYTIQVTSATLYGASMAYMLKDVYGVPYAMNTLLALLGTVAAIFSIPFWYNYSRKHGFRKTYYTTYILQGILYLPFLFSPNFWFHLIFYIIFQINGIGLTTMLMPVASDTYDEVSSNMGFRVDASMVGIRTFFFRVAFLVVFVVILPIHVLTGYNTDPTAFGPANQTAAALWGIRIHTALIPAILMITMGLIFKRYYTLEGKEKEALVKKLKDMGIYR